MMVQYISIMAGIIGLVLFFVLSKGGLRNLFLFIGLVGIFVFMWPIYKAYKMENGELNQNAELSTRQNSTDSRNINKSSENRSNQIPESPSTQSISRIEPQRNGEIWVTDSRTGERIVIPSIRDTIQNNQKNGDTVFVDEGENQKPKPGDTVF